MGQVIIEAGPCDEEGHLIAEKIRSEEVTSSGTKADTTMKVNQDDLIVVHNNQASVIWVAFGEDAAVGTTAMLHDNTSRAFKATQGGYVVSVIDDS